MGLCWTPEWGCRRHTDRRRLRDKVDRVFRSAPSLRPRRCSDLAAMVKPLFETADHWDLEEMIPPGVSKPGFDQKGGERIVLPGPDLRLTMFAYATPHRIAARPATSSLRLDHRNQPPLGLAVALNVALGRGEMGVPSQLLDVAQTSSRLEAFLRRARDEGATS